MITSKYDWHLNDKAVDDAFLKLAKEANLTEDAAKILVARGVDSKEALDDFLAADLSHLHDPYLLHDMEKSVARIRQAIENYEQILVYGDYDADGMTSASIIKETLEMMGAEAQVYLPNRFTDGYGPNLSVYKYFIEQQDISLIITVDNGVAGQEAISYAQEAGVDVIVTDHHSMPAELPNAYAIVHPEHPEADYPFKHLAGCGVAFKLATALLETIPTEMLDLVAIGTIADMVSLTDENRIMVKVGLQMLKDTERVGLQELMQISDIDRNTINEETVGFKIAPQLNALGRLDDPNPAIELLTGFDDDEAQAIVIMINGKNEERKEIVQTIFDEAMSMVDLDKPVQVLAKENWHPGVLGIVAGRIMEQISQTVVVLNIENGSAKGSARSLESINIFQALDDHRDIFTAFGGHAGAAGMTLPEENLETLSDLLCQFVIDNEIDTSLKNPLQLDEELQLEDLSLETIKSLEKLAPFGMDNKKPVFWLRHFQVTQARTMGQGNAHLKLKIQQGQASFDVVAFGQGALVQEFQQAQGLELAVTLSVNVWNGATTLQLMMEDARVDGVQLFDIRARNASLPSGVALYSEGARGPVLVLDELPESAEDLKESLANQTFQAIYFKNDIKQSYYLTGFGTRDQFAKLYKTIYQFPNFDVRYKLKELSSYLKIDQILLVKMIQIFEELGFVSISDGVMTVVKDAPKRAFEESSIYQELKATVKYQELMALGTPQEIYNWLTQE
ncbi:single-stranded-DNA-specific exonuclease RecJ [Streptococcus loxodontisalivarius]|uniref:Single-stranded-DNA-specific exonuclease RecJ n=1 Tax=Streptococcus loxodontisalivarius TaxID=1349415 RepID=A0ABS2PRH1_9STRE|nr:single-stranded-DNA-specific exonuclease RecJ [Streptococcus loxodontisalivarius]MBM7642644.1 single-stranded-DNA-specific exonuclease [Streptococcus loxodontisalivarius]